MTLFALAFLSARGCARTPAPEPAAAIEASPTLVVVRGLDPLSVRAFAGLPPHRRPSVLQVRVADAPPDAPPLLGDVTSRGNEIVFAPRYPFRPGLRYQARFDPTALGQHQPARQSDFAVPAPPQEPVARILAVYPSADELPENILKFYIQFSAPMSRGDAYRHVRLLDDRGQPVAAPFLELAEELWDPATTRLTLFFHPGRLKHGLVPRAEMGPALTPGRSYSLVIDAAWPDGEGRPLSAPYKKTFRTKPADAQQPAPGRWRITPPRAGSTDALVVDFDESLDHGMLQHVISVLDTGEQPIPGTVAITGNERRWSFTPASPWQPGRHVLAVDSNLEDTAGNSISRPFEVDLNQRPAPAQPPTTRISVEIGQPK